MGDASSIHVIFRGISDQDHGLRALFSHQPYEVGLPARAAVRAGDQAQPAVAGRLGFHRLGHLRTEGVRDVAQDHSDTCPARADQGAGMGAGHILQGVSRFEYACTGGGRHRVVATEYP